MVYVNGFGVGGYVLLQSTDGGQSWQPVPDDEFTREKIRWLLIPVQSPEKLYAAGNAGVFETEDGGHNWTFQNTRSPLASVDAIAISPVENGPTYACVAGSIYSSLDPEQGQWQRGQGLLAYEVRGIVADPLEANTAYAKVYLPNKWSVYITRDGGRNWQATGVPSGIPEAFLNDTTALDVAELDGGTILYIGTNGCGVLHSTDRGDTWEAWGRQDCSLPGEPKNVTALAIAPHSTDTVYAAADNNRVYVTEDRGRHWQPYPIPLTTKIIHLEPDPEIDGRVYLIAGSDGFWRSDDGARTWNLHSEGLEGKSIMSMVVDPDRAGVVFVGSTHGEVWRTEDSGQHWRSVREDLVVVDISAMSTRGLQDGILLGSESDRGGGIYRYHPGSLKHLLRGDE